jgi:site-specific DNA recombinase
MRLGERFENGTIKEKREIVGSIFPENLIFSGEYFRRLNEAVRQIYLIEKELRENKNGTSKVNFALCCKAEREGNGLRCLYFGYQTLGCLQLARSRIALWQRT